ncbi:type I 3-dehydroquinate dehydratase [Apilactobacillus sp. M161]|uniref:3-dehydroquinate dehydratase n=1 Tax=Apilactobacillus xinyiensis TaxID=2841032 RepID=A0ABT0I270_9LACO|nr:type I 3-dehydroquinate dehydratase [Apilactobacillus xinyiensis]MCK8624818.1 type I 3-dehydroquinate dehydratase [Apilactobacillus xinyiensis]
MTNSIKIKQISIGTDLPKIAVPITGTDAETVLLQANQIKCLNPDLIEWRIDCLTTMPSLSDLLQILNELTTLVDPIPIICTFRTMQEGGQQPLSETQYLELLNGLAADDNVAILDVEINHNIVALQQVVHKLHAHQAIALSSFHSFETTPEQVFMQNTLKRMQRIDADIFKLAVMPNTKMDVIKLMEFTQIASIRYPNPIVTMSMGKLGQLSRIAGIVTNSAITFASMDKQSASAPGQMHIEQLKNIFKVIK